MRILDAYSFWTGVCIGELIADIFLIPVVIILARRR